MSKLAPGRAREEILEAALAVLRRDGPAGLSTRTVAAQVGVTATALYRHFSGKEELLTEVVRSVHRVFQGVVAAPATVAPAAVLAVAADRYLQFALEHRNYYLLLFVEPHGIGIDRYPDDFRSGRSSTFRALRAAVEQAMTAGVLRQADPTDVALTVYAHLHGLIMLHFSGRFADDDERFAAFYHQSFDRLLHGLR